MTEVIELLKTRITLSPCFQSSSLSLAPDAKEILLRMRGDRKGCQVSINKTLSIATQNWSNCVSRGSPGKIKILIWGVNSINSISGNIYHILGSLQPSATELNSIDKFRGKKTDLATLVLQRMRLKPVWPVDQVVSVSLFRFKSDLCRVYAIDLKRTDHA